MALLTVQRQSNQRLQFPHRPARFHDLTTNTVAQALSAPDRRAMVDRDAPLPVTRQCRLLQVTRSTVYYEPVPVSDDTLRVMRAIDEIHLHYPFLGSRKLVAELVKRGLLVNRKRVQRLMGVMGVEAIYPRPRTLDGLTPEQVHHHNSAGALVPAITHRTAAVTSRPCS